MSVLDCGLCRQSSAVLHALILQHRDCGTETQQRSSRYVYFSKTASSEFIGSTALYFNNPSSDHPISRSHIQRHYKVLARHLYPPSPPDLSSLCLETPHQVTPPPARRQHFLSQSRLQLVITEVKSTDTDRTELGASKSENNNNNNTVCHCLQILQILVIRDSAILSRRNIQHS